MKELYFQMCSANSNRPISTKHLNFNIPLLIQATSSFGIFISIVHPTCSVINILYTIHHLLYQLAQKQHILSTFQIYELKFIPSFLANTGAILERPSLKQNTYISLIHIILHSCRHFGHPNFLPYNPIFISEAEIQKAQVKYALCSKIITRVWSTTELKLKSFTIFPTGNSVLSSHSFLKTHKHIPTSSLYFWTYTSSLL